VLSQKNDEIIPIKIYVLYKYRIWGGEKLKIILNKNYSEENIGESWGISSIENDDTLVAEGSLKGKSFKSNT